MGAPAKDCSRFGDALGTPTPALPLITGRGGKRITDSVTPP
jgi:hypothetical protein